MSSSPPDYSQSILAIGTGQKALDFGRPLYIAKGGLYVHKNLP